MTMPAAVPALPRAATFRRRRLALNLRQADLARAAGVPQIAVSTIERAHVLSVERQAQARRLDAALTVLERAGTRGMRTGKRAPRVTLVEDAASDGNGRRP